ncbi:MAG: L-2-hydroxyglutarate oxidase [Candidatus Sulfotelmatobacter sp.]
MTDSRYQVVVIGGGIVGLAVALEITRRWPRQRLLLLEKESRVGRHQSSHNSGVIHSGIYYKPGSLKAKLCVEGARAMIAFCGDQGIPHRICGKVIVATREEEFPRLEELLRRGEANGLAGLRVIGSEELREIEPHASGLRALVVPSTGVTEFGAVCEKYAELIRAQGGTILTSAEVTGLRANADEIVVETGRGPFAASHLINCAGLFSDRVSRMAGGKTNIIIVPFRGEYYDLIPERSSLVRALIYPVPDPQFPFLGVHFTRGIGGTVDAGPNAVLAFGREGYRRTDFNPRDLASSLAFPGFWRLAAKQWRYGIGEFYRSFSKRAFVRALQRLVPEVCEADLTPGVSGVRAQALRRDGTLMDDFYFLRSGKMLHVLNVPSPAATASLEIGRAVGELAAQNFGWQ